MRYEDCRSSTTLTSPEEAEKEFRKLLEELQKKGELDKTTFGYFSKAVRDRPSLLLTLKFIRDNLPEASVLDLGCGMGSLEAEICKSKKYECVGIDANKSFIRLASLRMKLHGYRNASFVLGDLRTLPLRRALFHTVVLHDVVFAVNLNNFMNEIGRVLKKGGRLVFDVPLAIFYRLIPVQRPFIKYSKWEVAEVLRKRGFSEESAFLTGMPPILTDRFHIPTELMRSLSKLLTCLPTRLQKLLSELWFAVLYIAKYGA